MRNKRLIGPMIATALLSMGLPYVMMPLPNISKANRGHDFSSNKNDDGTFSDSNGRRYTRDEKGTIRRVK